MMRGFSVTAKCARRAAGAVCGMARNREVELKFLVGSHRKGDFPSRALLGPLGGAKTAIETTYYDTRANELAARGLTVRLRKTRKKRILSVKSGSENGIARLEREVEIKDQWPSPAEWAAVAEDSPLARVPVQRRLKPQCTTTVERLAGDVKWKGSIIETSFDTGRIKTSSGELAIRELELESKSGSPEDLFSFARKLVDRLPLRISLISKGTRGALLASDRWGRPQPASQPELEPDDDGVKAVQKICMTCLKDLMINEVATDGVQPVGGVHKMRIAVRRLRAALSLFRSALRNVEAKKLQRELKWLSDILGVVRNLDVAMDASAGWSGKPPGTKLLIRRLKGAQSRARKELGSCLRSRRYRVFLFNLVRWLEIGKWRKQPSRDARSEIPLLAGKLLRQRLDTLLDDGHDLDALSLEQLHDIRKDAKSLRYCGEFFRSLVRDRQQLKEYDKLLEVLEDIQKALGRLQDQATQEELLRGLIRTTDRAKTRATLETAIETITAEGRIEEKTARKQTRRAIRKMRALKPVLFGKPMTGSGGDFEGTREPRGSSANIAL
jgi:inorganic triphosphatase YgiF